ncbi:MAG: DUF1549 and DUF1553 domain-containing protein [Pirellulaceae bacterium]|nr:DUF1549 and DUF1553 domain-containing protein [Pirellulaceae bacterium]
MWNQIGKNDMRHLFRFGDGHLSLWLGCLVTVMLAVGQPVLGNANDAELELLRVYPAKINLSNARDRQSLLVQAVFVDGVTRDVTREAEFVVADSDVARMEQNVVFGESDAETTLLVRFAGKEVALPLKAVQANHKPPVSFKLDVMPVFMKAGCNTGSCHGAARGKDGFRLSLFGFDPDGDYHRLTREISGRRINLALPEDCLVMNKATGKVPHSGGKRLEEGSEPYETLVEWLNAGAPQDEGEVPAVTRVEIFPENAVLRGEGAQHQITVRATYSDGSDRDVTSLAYFLSNNDNSAGIDQEGVVTAAKRGEAFIMARFETHTVGTHFIVLPTDDSFSWQETPEYNYIDTLMHHKFRKLRIQPSDVCTDEEFLRRASLDITGTVPTVEEYRQFMESTSDHRRDELVEQLLERKEFVEMWVMKWAELLQIRSSNGVSYKSALLYYNWLQERISNNVPTNQMVAELLASNGGTFANAATNYYQNETNTLKVAENVAQVFMGMRIQCAQCHNHPFDRWTMDDYYSFAAFFSQIGRKDSEDPREKIVFDSGAGEVKHPVGGRVMPPKFLGGEFPDLQGHDRRELLAEWLASPDNPYFARNLANIVWAHFFGRGIIHEVDDVRVSNPPVNAELLDELARRMTEYNYDFKRFVRDICTSKTYQLSTTTNPTNESDVRNFSHATLRRMRSEVLLDVISQVTDTKNKFRGLPLGARAVQIADGNTSTYFLEAFGRASRESVCSCEVKMEPNLSQALHLLNGDTVKSKLEDGNVVGRLLEGGSSADDVLDELYVRCLCRHPQEDETIRLKTLLAQADDEKIFLEDAFWALLNSREFLFNH